MPATDEATRATVKRLFQFGPPLAAFPETTTVSPVLAPLAKHPRAIIANAGARRRIVPDPSKASRAL